MTAWGLALHATSSQLGLALGTNLSDLRWRTWDLNRELSVQLHVRLAEFLAPQNWSDLAFIAVATGPGSFTSTRVGVVAARTLAQQLEIPLFGISTLAAAAWRASQPHSAAQASEATEAIAVRMTARRQQLFGAVYGPTVMGLETHLPVATFTSETWLAALEGLAIACRELELPEALGTDVIGVFALALLAWQAGQRPHWSTVVPFYGQHPIEPAKIKRTSQMPS
ncbi:MAG: tRNA (adenosine(37)-N6)-threonylcarbamoyltransferase complex dimerization subunit type 1 TsaB [Cyanobacteria bacterium J06641_5]